VSIAISFASILSLALGYFIAALIATATGFILHEMGHKFVAIRYGYVAHFQIWVWGILLILPTGIAAGVSGFPFLFGAPGAVYIEPAVAGSFGHGYYSSTYRISDPRRENMLISAAGPGLNLLFMVIFLVVYLISPGFPFISTIGKLGFALNAGLGSFNMIPFPPLDGYKIFRGNAAVGLAIALPLWITVAVILFGI
jgi:Zn-dependent protease